MSLYECMDSHSSSEFIEWMRFLHWKEWEEDTRIHYYLAQIAAEIYNFRLMFCTGKHKPANVEDKLIKFTPKGEKPKEAPPQPRPDPKTPEGLAAVQQEVTDTYLKMFEPLIKAGLMEVEDGTRTAATT